MMRRFAVLLVVVGVACGVVTLRGPQTGTAYGLAGLAARGQFASRVVEVGSVWKRMPGLSGGMTFTAQQALDQSAIGAQSGPVVASVGCANRTSAGDIRVNQDCTFRRQSGGAIAINPTNPLNLLAGQNDSSIGLNHCAYDYSLDGGK